MLGISLSQTTSISNSVALTPFFLFSSHSLVLSITTKLPAYQCAAILINFQICMVPLLPWEIFWSFTRLFNALWWREAVKSLLRNFFLRFVRSSEKLLNFANFVICRPIAKMKCLTTLNHCLKFSGIHHTPKDT